jgi:hypothetical protein
MSMAARDYYEEARQLARCLAEEGFRNWAEELEAAITAGFTATEILMGLRWKGQQLKSAELRLTAPTRQKLEDLLVGLEEVLSR